MKRAVIGCVWLLLVTASCGDGGRTVQAHYDSGNLRSEGREQRGTDGAWLKNGPFLAWHETGELAEEGHYSGDAPGGKWTSWYSDGSTKSRGSYLFGQKEGVWVHRLADGSIDPELTGIYEAGSKTADFLIDGVQEDEFAKGRPRERVAYVDGLRHGTCTTWYPSGAKRSEGQYENGRKTGKWSYWKEDGAPDPGLTGVYDGWHKISNERAR